jgi:hypothetical protein
MARKKSNKPLAYAWVAYMFTHQPDEIKRVLKFKTPSDSLIKLAEQPIGMTLSDGKFKVFEFPVSLNKAAGQKLLYEATVRIDTYLKTIPIQAYDVLQYVTQNVTHRRKDTQGNVHMVAEAILHRAACEFKHEILFAFDSINVWIKAVYGKELGYLTIRKCLELLVEAKIIKVNEWGKRGNRSKCTKIEFLPVEQPKEYILTYTSNLDDWLMFNDHAMNKVYSRESATRQDVLVERIYHYADELADQSIDGPAWPELRSLFGTTDGTMTVADEVSAQSSEKVTTHVRDNNQARQELYLDRRMGRMVPTLQEDSTHYREGSSKVLTDFDFTESRC